MPPAARVGDNHECKGIDPKPHVGGRIAEPCSKNVHTNGRGQARATDRLTCQGPPNFIVTGSATVHVNGLPAARVTDKTMHPGPPGDITDVSHKVHIGGPAEGATLGNKDAGTAACLALQAGREGESSLQAPNDCGTESCRQIINRATGKNYTEQKVLSEAEIAGYAARGNKSSEGTTTAENRQKILKQEPYNIDSGLQDQNMPNIAQAVAEGRGVISSVDPDALQGKGSSKYSHAVVPIAIRFNAQGEPEEVFANDTGTAGGCGQSFPAKVFEGSLLPKKQINVTDHPIW
jgi:uncharacterized Zn-binding protein involved in type VI secretion